MPRSARADGGSRRLYLILPALNCRQRRDYTRCARRRDEVAAPLLASARRVSRHPSRRLIAHLDAAAASTALAEAADCPGSPPRGRAPDHDAPNAPSRAARSAAGCKSPPTITPAAERALIGSSTRAAALSSRGSPRRSAGAAPALYASERGNLRHRRRGLPPAAMIMRAAAYRHVVPRAFQLSRPPPTDRFHPSAEVYAPWALGAARRPASQEAEG